MAAAAEPPETPAGGLDVDLEVNNDGVRLRFRCTTGAMVILGVTGVTIGAFFGKEHIKPIVEGLCNSVFGFCKLTTGSLVIDVDCFTVTRVKELLDAYRCGKLKRKFLEELQKIGGTVEDLEIKFAVTETLQLNKDREQRILSKGEVKERDEGKKSMSKDEGRKSMWNQEFLETVKDIRKLDGAKDKIISDLNYGKIGSYLRDEYGRTHLHYAALSSNRDLMNILLKFDPSIVDVQGYDGRTALHLLCLPCYDDHKYQQVSNLLRNGAGINVKDSEDRTPLHYGAMYNEDLVTYLISREANIFAIDYYGKTPFDYAFEHDNVRAIDDLIVQFSSHEVDEKSLIMKNINVIDKAGRNILHHAAKTANEAVINKLVDSGVNVNDVDNNGMSALDHALACENLKNAVVIFSIMLEKNVAFEKLIEKIASFDGKNDEGQTVLHIAANHGDERVVEQLIKMNADVNEIDNQGRSALHYSIEQGNVVAAIKLLEAGASVNGKNNKGQTVLHIAANHGDERVVEQLIKMNADVNEIDNQGRSALHYSIERGNMLAAMKLLEAGASVKQKNDEGQTVLHLAVNHGGEELILLLLKNNEVCELLNDLDCKGKSVLYYALEKASETGDPNIAFQLVKAGAKAPLVKDAQGKTLLHNAVQENKLNFLNILFQCNLDLNDHDNEGKAALHYAVDSRNKNATEMLIKAGADVNVREITHKFTPLHLAAMRRYDDIIQLLLNYNANPKLEDYIGKTAMAYTRNPDIVKKMQQAIANLSLEDNGD